MMARRSITEFFDLGGKGAIVTGGATGIGKAIALRLAEAGARVMVTHIDIYPVGRSKAGGTIGPRRL